MWFELSVFIQRSSEEVFIFLRDKDLFPQPSDSPVLVLEKIGDGPVALGTRYREVVRMFPGFHGEFLSCLTGYDPPQLLEEEFSGPGMSGRLAYRFLPEGTGTRLIQQEWIRTRGVARLFAPLLYRMLGRRLKSRLESIRALLDGGWKSADRASRASNSVEN